MHSIRVTSREKVESASYHLKLVAQVWFTQWKDSKPAESCPLEWEDFKEAFSKGTFPVRRGSLRLRNL